MLKKRSGLKKQVMLFPKQMPIAYPDRIQQRIIRDTYQVFTLSSVLNISIQDGFVLKFVLNSISKPKLILILRKNGIRKKYQKDVFENFH